MIYDQIPLCLIFLGCLRKPIQRSGASMASLFRLNVNDSGEARVAATLCLTIAEQFAGVLHLVRGGFSSHAPILVRSMLEGVADLLNLVHDANYLDQLHYENARNDALLFDGFMDDPEMKRDAKALATLRAWKAKAQPIRDEFHAKGFRPISAIEKFRRAKIQSTYVAYRTFSAFAHSGLTTLLARHADYRFELRYHDEAPPETTGSALTIAISILCNAFATLPRFTDISENELKQELDAIDAAWTAARASS